MELKKMPYELAVCKLKNVKDIDLNEGFYNSTLKKASSPKQYGI